MNTYNKTQSFYKNKGTLLLPQEKQSKRICFRCEKETSDTPCPYCGGGVFKFEDYSKLKVPPQNIKI
ncbi:MAG: hypothetical protein UT24_C0016G0044 [Candidatus Woesebacteria bacterium GW2011_GWB1_39_12]|uniref:Uncharacterized protein n=1 Tax=Candidatus Woesebacteria bacterium GW2011_GWB1_39_12 TaxID=1618574 RepID=A0A0G0PPR4_9BACT|nr:MAG: hypothetical protein UT24_C0016G0044 [Candidatus Woesebacteria bacterium GW2011_GWB1_39_12]